MLLFALHNVDVVQSLKGVSGEVVVLEEAAYCDPGLVNEVVVPLLSMQSSVLLCISTLLDGANHYSKMINLRDEHGAKVFESLQISLVCGTNRFMNTRRSQAHLCAPPLFGRRLPQNGTPGKGIVTI